MAQTKRKRRSKHRGNAAGTVESRGRTGRRPTAQEREPGRKQTMEERRLARLDRPPSWRSAFIRAVVASVVFFVLVFFVFKEPLAASAFLTLFTLIIYTPLGYYTDGFLYRRRQRRTQADRAGRTKH